MPVTYDLDTEPEVTRTERTIAYEWIVGQTAGDEESKTVLLVLRVTHHKKGVNMFAGEGWVAHYSANITNEHQLGGEHGVRTYRLASGMRILTRDAARYSKARHEEFAEEALALLRQLVHDGNDQVLPYARGEAG